MHVGVRELKARASEILDLVEGGETVVVTRRGKDVARLVPSGPMSDMDVLIARGEVRAPRRKFRPRSPTLTLEGDGPTMTEIISEGRGPR